MAATQKQRYQFVNDLLNHAPKAKVQDAQRLLRYGATYSRIQEMWCNVEMNDRQTEAFELKEKRIEQNVTKLLGTIDCKAIFGGDPRGSTIKIVLPDGYTDDWGKEELCIPTA